MMFGLEDMDCSDGLLLILKQPAPAAMEKEAIPIVFKNSRRVCLSSIPGAFHFATDFSNGHADLSASLWRWCMNQP
jgi:hypothetical protein